MILPNICGLRFLFLFLLYNVNPFDLAVILVTSEVILRQLVGYGKRKKNKNSEQEPGREHVYYLGDLSFYINKQCNLDSLNVRIQAWL